MSKGWKLRQSTFTPAQVAAITGVAPGTQRQWWRRGFLGERENGHARVTVAEMASILALRECADFRVNLEVAAKALPTLSATALYTIAHESAPWTFAGSEADRIEYEAWAAAKDVVSDDFIVEMLELPPSAIQRFVSISHRGVNSFHDPFDLIEEKQSFPMLIIDSSEIGRTIVSKTQTDLLIVA